LQNKRFQKRSSGLTGETSRRKRNCLAVVAEPRSALSAKRRETRIAGLSHTSLLCAVWPFYKFLFFQKCILQEERLKYSIPSDLGLLNGII
jgi:hypothetical protein